jgi:HEAT repeat protein
LRECTPNLADYVDRIISVFGENMKLLTISAAIATVLTTTAPVCAHEKDPEPGSFEEKALNAFQAQFFTGMEVGALSGFECFPLLARLSEDEDQVKCLKALANFPDDLVNALRSGDAKRQDVAIKYLSPYVGLHRFCSTSADNGQEAVRIALGKHFESIKDGLKLTLKTGSRKWRCHAAGVLLILDPRNDQAVAVLASELKATQARRRKEACEVVETLYLDHEDVVARIVEAVTDINLDVRRAAALAVANLGPKACKAVPGLIKLLKGGEDAYAVIPARYAIAYPRTKNVALLALAAMGADAGAAVPEVCKVLTRASNAEPIDRNDPRARYGRTDPLDDALSCLAQLGPAAPKAVPHLRKLLDKSDDTGFSAAAVLLCIDRADRQARDTLLTALKSSDNKTAAVEACAAFGPKVSALIPALLELLKEDRSCESAAAALAHMGPLAKDAIPALIPMLTNERDFITRSRAAHALAAIGKTSIPELVRVLRDRKLSEGRKEAVRALSSMGKDAADTVPILIEEALADKEDSVRRSVVIALGRLQRHAAPARPFLQRLVDGHRNLRAEQDPQVVVFAAWALTQLSR